MKVGVIGSLVDTDLVLAELLLRLGVDARVCRTEADAAPRLDLPFYRTLAADGVHTFGSPAALLHGVREFDFLFSVTSGLHVGLRYLAPLYPALRRAGWPGYMVICSGSNIMERAIEAGPKGLIERSSLAGSYCAMLNPYPVALRNARRLRRPRWVFLPFPYPVDPAAVPEPAPVADAGELRVLHASNQDWGETDCRPGRSSTKGNDRFLRAFVRACRDGLRAHCDLVDRGPDRFAARRLIQALGAEDLFTWHSEMARRALHEMLARCGLLVDQFDVGAFGGIAVEAMVLGKPCLAHVDPASFALVFAGPVPTLTARTEEEIYRVLCACADPGFRRQAGVSGRDWVRMHYDPEALGRRYLFYAEAGAGWHDADGV